MNVSRKININVPKTVEKAVNGNEDFHFYVDELTSNDCMPTYVGRADEKYTFESMDDAFFEFLERKIHENGINIRMIHATGESASEGAVFTLECGNMTKTFKTSSSEVLVFEFADFGIKVLNDEVTLGTTVDGGCHHAPFFAEFGSDRGNREVLSFDNPLNKFVMDLLLEMIVLDE